MSEILAPPPASARTTRRSDLGSKEAEARLRRRYRAERRFQAYGLIALALTTVFLMVLIADILSRGLPAFWQYSVVLDVPVTAEEIDPDNKRAELARRAAELSDPLRRLPESARTRSGPGASMAVLLWPGRLLLHTGTGV